MAGFESACHINRGGRRLDMLAVTQHDAQVAHDYELLKLVGIRTARDGVRWPLIDRGARYDFASLTPAARAAAAAGIQIIWDLFHYGWPDDLDVFGAAFVDRYARFVRAVVRHLRDICPAPRLYTPANEISFLSWAAGQVRWFYPHARDRSPEFKRQMVRAAIAGMQAIWEEDPGARILHTDPLIHVVPPHGQPHLAVAAARQRESQFEAWDMLSGRLAPELGGQPRYLDVIGVCFYHANQWEYPDSRLRWEDSPRDHRWVPLHRLLGEVYQRYRRPLCIAETSHFGIGRAPWLREIAAEACEALRSGIPLEGVCLYPILDRPDWEDLTHWHNSGLYDLVADDGGVLRRVLNPEYAEEFRRARALLDGGGCRMADRASGAHV